MVSNSELVHRLREVLRTSDLNTATATGVRRTLEAEFGVDLSDRKAFIRDQMDLFLQSILGVMTDQDGVDDNAEDEIDEEGRETAKHEDDNSDSGSEDNGFDPDEDEEEEEEEEESDGKRRMNGRRNMVDNVVEKKGGFSKPCGLSPQLQKFLGVPELARSEVVKKIWAYIREKNLQDQKDRRKILCDEALRPLFGGNSIGMFQMNKALSKHIWPLNEENVPVKASQKEKQQKQEGGEVPVKSSQNEKQRKRGREGSNKRQVKRHKGKGSGFLAPLPLSDALVQFIGTGENELSRNDVVKRTWEYIKQNNLQDPSDKRRIICDEKLKELVEVDSFTGLALAKLLTVHFIKVEQ